MPAAKPTAAASKQPTKLQQEVHAMRQLQRKVENQAKEEWEQNIGRFKRGEVGDAEAAKLAQYYNKVQKRA